MKKFFSLGILLVLATLFLFGCTTPSFCGDGICSGNEAIENCPEDCGGIIVFEQARFAWKSATPFAIVDWAYMGDELTVILKNNSAFPLRLEQFRVRGSLVDLNIADLKSGEVDSVVVVIPNLCENNMYTMNKDDIKIVYANSNIGGITQIGAADILGWCN